MTNLKKEQNVNIRQVNLRIDKIDDLKNFVNLAGKLKSNTEVVSGRFIVDAKSIMGMLSLNLSQPVSLIIRSIDDSETEDFLDEINALIVEPENNTTKS